MRLPFFGLVLGTSLFACTVVLFSACSGGDARPDAGSGITPGSSGSFEGGGSSSGSPGGDGSAADSGQDANVEPPSCSNTVRDGQETDTDCGGAVCKKCFDGKKCIAPTDCAGGACINNVCVTPKCNDLNTNGDETDTDCGGSVCARCTIGKRCKAGGDCVSGACSTTGFCQCPTLMTEVSKQGGNGAYCIDSFEVSKFHYNKFITANVNIADQIPACLKPTNDTFVPRAAWPPIESGTPNQQVPAGTLTTFNNSLPVHYVDWCDAYAYCKWANKQLCGGIGGGAVAPSLADSADAGSWYNACSAQGVNQWPYSSSTFDSRCNGQYVGSDGGGPAPQFNGYAYAVNKDEGLRQLYANGDPTGGTGIIWFASCAGGVTGLYQMSGNVAEWEDSCDGTAPDSKCRVRGGSFFADNDAGTLSCKGMRTEQRVPEKSSDPDTDITRDIGFRCCLY